MMSDGLPKTQTKISSARAVSLEQPNNEEHLLKIISVLGRIAKALEEQNEAKRRSGAPGWR